MGLPRVFRLTTVAGQRAYGPKVPKDAIVLVEISQEQQCPHCKMRTAFTADYAYTVQDIEEMYRAVFMVWVLPSKIAKYADQFRQLISRELAQAKFNLEQKR